LDQDFFSEELLDDKDLFLAYAHSERLQDPNYCGAGFHSLFYFLSQFSKRLRGDAALMFEAAELMGAYAILPHLSECLKSDCFFAKELVKIMEEAPDYTLKFFKRRVRANRGVVLALVRKNGRCLRDADDALKCDCEILRAACENNASALVFSVPNSLAQRQIVENKDAIMDIFSRWPRHISCDPQMYQMLPATLKLDWDIVVAACKTGNLSQPDDLPAELAGDGEFWTHVIKQNSLFWRDLPTEFEGDPAFARIIDRFCDKELVENVFSRFLFLANERSMWFGVIASFQGESVLQPLIRDHAPDHIRRDKELMVLACKNDCQVLRELSGTDLLWDRDILEAALEESCTALWLIPASSQCLFPDLVVRAFSNFDGEHDFNDFMEVVAKPLWANMDVCRAWLKSLGDVHSHFPEVMKKQC